MGLLHGKLSPSEKETAMEKFQRGETQILVATTVIEVGVDVPNATVMLIEQAERFGLAQLHQLRGRVGRGAEQSYCILVTGKLNPAARERIRTLVESNDGFYIAEMDMKLRGPGEFFGTKQSGLPALRDRQYSARRGYSGDRAQRGCGVRGASSGGRRFAPGGDLSSGSLAAAVWIGARRLSCGAGLRPAKLSMRVIGGEFRSRVLKSVPGLDTRPTPDRLREALFNVLAPRISGAVFADLYAGTGAVGIEALSRGASRAIFVENNRAAARVIHENLRSLGLEPRAQVREGRVRQMLPKLDAGIVFLDPPYELATEYAFALGLLGSRGYKMVIVQHDVRLKLEESYGSLKRRRVMKQGDNVLSFYEAESANVDPEP